jgi:quercetin dioxygenase-like cupin family protein
MSRKAVIVALAAGIAIGAAATVAVGQAQVERKMLGATLVAGTDREAHIGTGDFPVGGVIGRHFHPGEELAYVAEGQVLLSVEGHSDRLLKAGESYIVPRAVVHSARAEGGAARVVAVWIIDKGQPLARPAP